MTELSFYDGSNVPYSACLDYSTTFFDAFRNDIFFRTFHTDYFGLKPTVPEPQRSEYLGALGRSSARRTKLRIMKGTDVLFLMRDGNKAVATCLCTLPVYKQRKLTWLQWIKVKIYEYYANCADFFDRNPSKKLRTPEQEGFFGAMYSEGTGAKRGPEYLAKLAELSKEELVEASYPANQTLYVNILAVANGCQGKGYGSGILKAALDHYKDLEGPSFVGQDGHESQAPAKTSLFPTEGKEPFYKRYGFKVVGSSLAPLMDGETFEHLFMQRLIKLD